MSSPAPSCPTGQAPRPPSPSAAPARAGSAAEAGELRITFDGIEDPLVLQVRQATRSSAVIWDVESCAFLPDWAGTTPAFTLSRSSAGGCDLEFRHEGLS